MTQNERRILLAITLGAIVVVAMSLASLADAAPVWFGTLSAEKQASILWKEDHETAINGDAGSWDNGAGTPWDSGDSDWGVTTTAAQVHSGNKALWSRIDTGDGESGVRWPMRHTSPTWKSSGLLPDAYYSGWIKMPVNFSSQWYMLMQWKTAGSQARNGQSDPIKSVNFHRTGGVPYLHLTDFVGSNGKYNESGNTVDNSPIPFPVNEWVHLEAYYTYSTSSSGTVIVWQDGVEILRQENTRTQYPYTGSSYPRQWAINAYGAQLSPNPHTMYLDDAAISSSRLSEPDPVGLAGDFNDNGTVDAADFVVWRDGVGSPGDYQIWRANFGASLAGVGSVAVVEPRTFVLALVAGVMVLVRRERLA